MSPRNEMSIPRRYLPSFALLSAFEAVARRGSVTDAARELSLTQGAVSRQLQKLEDQIGAALFVRDKQRLGLTPAGAAYLEDVRRGMNLISSAGIKLHVNPNGGALNLAVLPAFGAHWLAPRLSDFVAKCGGVTVNLSTRTRPFDFAGEDFHAAIHFGSDNWAGADSLCLMEERAIAVASPDIVIGDMTASGKNVIDFPLLHLETRPGAWRAWFSHQGVDDDNLPGVQFDQFASMIQAAIFGLGAAIVPEYLVQAELRSGKLVKLGAQKPSVLGSYYLVWPETGKNYPALVQFKEWIATAVQSQTTI